MCANCQYNTAASLAVMLHFAKPIKAMQPVTDDQAPAFLADPRPLHQTAEIIRAAMPAFSREPRDCSDQIVDALKRMSINDIAAVLKFVDYAESLFSDINGFCTAAIMGRAEAGERAAQRWIEKNGEDVKPFDSIVSVSHANAVDALLPSNAKPNLFVVPKQGDPRLN